MAALDGTAGARPLDGGRVIRNAIAAIRADGATYLLGALLTYSLPVAASSWIRLHFVNPGTAMALIAPQAAALIQSLGGAYFTAWMTLAIVRRSGSAPHAHPLGLAERVASRAWPIGLAGLMFYLGVVGGTILLIVPGLMLATAWSVSMPALAAEGLSPRRAFGRSLELTRGHRWMVFALSLIVFVPTGIANIVLVEAISGGAPLAEAMRTPLAAIGVLPLIGALENVAISAGLAALYVELVSNKDGALHSAIGAVFD
jgi:hypothetical protein